MIASPAFRGRRYAVLGLARSGLATVEALVASGAEVTAWDKSEKARGKVAGTVRLADPLEIDLSGYDGVVVSPGVPLNSHPIAGKARAAGVPLIGDIELFAQARADLPPHKVVGITGTNGKSTTTALVHHILRTAGVPAAMGGNIGLPILAQEPLPAGGVYVLELSSYQLDLTYSLDCDVAVLSTSPPIISTVTTGSRPIGPRSCACSRCSPKRMSRYWTAPPMRWRRFATPPSRRGSASWTRRGWPSTSRAGRRCKGRTTRRMPALRSQSARRSACPGTRSRPDCVPIPACRTGWSGWRSADGILFVNDSKATNPDSTAPALAAYPYVHWIVGGLAKTKDLGPCERELGHVRAAYTIGEAGPMFARLLEGRVPVRECELLVTAVGEAADAAKAGEVVLLSPACASFDQFRDYEARGDAFRAAVEALA